MNQYHFMDLIAVIDEQCIMLMGEIIVSQDQNLLLHIKYLKWKEQRLKTAIVVIGIKKMLSDYIMSF